MQPYFSRTSLAIVTVMERRENLEGVCSNPEVYFHAGRNKRTNT